MTALPKSVRFPGTNTFARPKDILLTRKIVGGSTLASITREMEALLTTNSGLFCYDMLWFCYDMLWFCYDML